MNYYKHTALIMLSILVVFGMFFENVSNGHAQSNRVWSEPINLSTSGSTSNPIMVIDASGTIHIIWIDTVDENYKYVQSKDGLSWTSPVTVNFPFPTKDSSGEFPFTVEDFPPLLVPDASGLIHIFWRNEKSALFYNQTLAENLGNPSAWSGYTQLADTALDFDVILDSKGTVHVGFLRNTNSEVGPAGIYYRQLLFGRLDWSKPSLLYESQYFRGLNYEDAHVRLDVSSEGDAEKVYVVWDDRPQKRIFLAKSVDGGLAWDKAEQIRGPEDFSGYQLPFNIEVNAFNETTILLWQIGDPGIRCTQYSQVSLEGSENWDKPIKMLDEFSECPERVVFFTLNENFSLAILIIQGESSLIAWNGKEWSEPQLQSELSTFSNPVTFDGVLLGCQQFSLYNNLLYVMGCDQGVGGDIWFTSRPVGTLENWFPPPSIWSPPKLLKHSDRMISSLSSVADEDSIHLLWVESSESGLDKSKPTIQYSLWQNDTWSIPVTVVTGLNEIPIQLSLVKDWERRLLLVWVDKEQGNLFFSWANMDSANLSSEWAQPLLVPSISQLNSSPDILVDSSGRIVVAFAVPVNEKRGIYIIQSDNLGETWTPPILVFDAVSAGWERIDEPKISLGSDGRLHLLFSQYSIRGNDNQPVSLYYSQSINGGTAWSEPELVSDRSVQWSSISSSRGILCRLWQEKDGEVFNNFYQFSNDEGQTWTSQRNVGEKSDTTSKLTLVTDPNGKLHMLQILSENDPQLEDNNALIAQDWQWDGDRWLAQGDRKTVDITGENFKSSFTAAITSQGNLIVSFLVGRTEPDSGLNSTILSIGRSIEVMSDVQLPFPLLIATPDFSANTTDLFETETTPTELSSLANLEDTNPPPGKNLVGLLILGALAIIFLMLIVPSLKRRSV